MGYLLDSGYPRCIVGGHGGLPSQSQRVGGSLQQRGGLPGILVPTPVARWISVPALRRCEELAAPFGAPGMRQLWVSNVGHGGGDVSRHAKATGVMVSNDVVGNQPEERGQRLGSAACPWV